MLVDQKLLTKLSEEDLVATEAANYHTTCLAKLYNRVRNHNRKKSKAETEEEIVCGVVLGEIVENMKLVLENKSETPI